MTTIVAGLTEPAEQSTPDTPLTFRVLPAKFRLPPAPAQTAAVIVVELDHHVIMYVCGMAMATVAVVPTIGPICGPRPSATVFVPILIPVMN